MTPKQNTQHPAAAAAAACCSCFSLSCLLYTMY